ncbi:MAG: hypothetical protein AAFY82_00160 [Pseudomonadota bacterium]
MADDLDDYRPLEELAGDFNITGWQPPGPKSLAYLSSSGLVRALAGPYGCGKTTTVFIGEVFNAMRSPICLDGVRRYSLLTTRDSYRQLYKTAISTWHQWFPPTVGVWSGGQDRPAEHKLKFVDDHGPVEFTHQFAALPDMDIRDWLDGFEVSAIFMNAATSQPKEVMSFGLGRIGRYPRQALLPPGYKIDKHVAMDLNKSDVDHWIYDTLEAARDRDVVDFIDLPGGMEKGAENLQNLTPGYYEDMARANPDWWVRIYVHNRWGPSRHGNPVYDTFRQNRHVANGDLDALPELELYIGLDAGTEVGGRPAAVFFQVTPFGRARVIDELYLGRCGPSRFFEAMLRKLEEPHLREANTRMRAWCDPSAFGGADTESGEMTWVEVGEAALGIPILPAESNELEGFRLETVRILLREAEGDEQGLILSPRCVILIKGFNSAYAYEIKEIAGVKREDPKPKKNEVSHPHDALQHGVTGFFGKSFVENAVRRRRLNPDDARIGERQHGFQMDFDLFQ